MNSFDLLFLVFDPCNNSSVSFWFYSSLVVIDSSEVYNPKNRK